MVGLLWLSLPICLPDGFTFSFVKRLKKKKERESEMRNEIGHNDFMHKFHTHTQRLLWVKWRKHIETSQTNFHV